MLTFTKSMLALSVMAAVGGANAATYTEDTTLTDKIFTQDVVALGGATVTVTGDEIAGKFFKATNHSDDVNGKYSYKPSKLLLGNADTKKITINNSSKEALQKPLFPSRIEQNRSVRFFFTTSKKMVFFLPSK